MAEMISKQKLVINQWQSIFANVFICTLPTVMIALLPLLVGGLVISLGYTEQQGGYVAAADMVGYTVGTIGASLVITKINWRKAVLLWLVVMAVANFLCGWVSDFSTLVSLRFVSGLGGGIVTAITFAAIGQMRDPDSVYGLWLVFQGVIGGIGSITFSSLIESWGLNGGFVIFSVLIFAGCLLVGFVPVQAIKHTTVHVGYQSHHRVKLSLSVVAILLMYIALTGVYAYLERIGSVSGLSLEQIGECFLAMMMTGIVGGLAASQMGSKYGRTKPIIISTLLIVLSFVILALADINIGYFKFMLIAALFYGMWSFLLPYLVGALAEVDTSGKAVSLGNAAIGGGLAFGPFVATFLIGDGYTLLVAYGAMTLFVGMLLMLPLAKASES